jgi:hypothetical protein
MNDVESPALVPCEGSCAMDFYCLKNPSALARHELQILGPMVSTKADKKIKKVERLKCRPTCLVAGELKSNMTLSVLYAYEELMECMIFLQILCIEYVV